jgi:dolichol-phosphate mannosyltransferase
MRVLVVVPTYLEAENIEQFLRALRGAAADVDVLVVDDGSPDGTADLAERLAPELGRIDVLRRPGKAGLGAAYRAGFSEGIERGYEALVEIDADLSHDPRALPTMLEAIQAGADAVVGSRYIAGGSVEHWPFVRRALSKWGNRYAAFVLGISMTDTTSGYRVYRAGALQAADYSSTRSTGYAFQIELSYRVITAGHKLVEVPIVFVDRVRGQSKMSLRIALEAMITVTYWGVRARSRRRGPRAGEALNAPTS